MKSNNERTIKNVHSSETKVIPSITKDEIKLVPYLLFSIDNFKRELLQKEKDLELAAKIGKSLLDQNQELRERNSFLNDSLAKNADIISELKHQVQYKEKLIRSIKKDDDIEVLENEKNINTSLDYLKNKVDGLRKENNVLINETKELRTLNKNYEDEKKILVEQYTRRLDKANLHISKLQNTINEKDQECAGQTKEIEKLMKEILEQKNREKVVVEDNALLTERLEEMLSNHELLKGQIFELQDKYIEVFEMFKEAEEELFKIRKKSSTIQRSTFPQRTMSSDSLYDSLTSEIEIHDSGVYNTPMVSARSISRNSNILSFQKNEDGNISKNYPVEENLSNELAAIGYDNIFTNTSNNCVTQSNDNENTDDELISFPIIYDNGNYIKNDNIEHPNDPISNISTPLIEKNSHILASSTPIKTIINNEKVLETKDVSCSPIQELLDNYYIHSNESTPRIVVKQNVYYDNDYDNNDVKVVKLKRQLTYQNKTNNLMDNSTSTNVENLLEISNDNSISINSLSKYTTLNLGAPGKLGTNDLELCINRKNARRKKVQEDYNKYREAKGLGQSKYPLFQEDSIKEKFNFSYNKKENLSNNGNSTLNYDNLKNITINDNDLGINTLTTNDNNKQILNGVVLRSEINCNVSKSSTNTPIKTFKSGKIVKLSNTSSFSLSSSPSSGKDFLLQQTSSSRCSSPSITIPKQIEASIDNILSGTESQQKNSGVIERIDIFSEIKNNRNQNE